MRYIPTEKDLNTTVKLVDVKVKGRYIARLNEKATVSRNYEIQVLLPEGFTLSDVKRQTPKVLKEKLEDFLTMRDFYPQDKGKKTDKTVKRRDLYTEFELERFAKLRADAKKAEREEANIRRLQAGQTGIAGDTSEYDPETGLPPVINE